MIDRKTILKHNNPHLSTVDFNSPLTVGNSSIGFTVDPTGLQTLSEEYEKQGVSLCTLSNWGWNSFDDFKLDDLTFTEYQTNISKRNGRYPTECLPGEKELYQGLRENPHRANLLRIRFLQQGKVVKSTAIEKINQELDLYSGVIVSNFKVNEEHVRVKTFVGVEDVIGIQITGGKSLNVEVSFSNSSPKMDARDQSNSDFVTIFKQQTNLVNVTQELKSLHYNTDLVYQQMSVLNVDEHRIVFGLDGQDDSLLQVRFNGAPQDDFDDLLNKTMEGWHQFWSSVGFVQLPDQELQRRFVLSEYLLHVNCSGKIPPQETGLTINSWSGKFHLEMVPWHEAWLTLYNRTADLEPVIDWYRQNLPKAQQNAAINNYKGARWPKQIGPDFVESPSPISPIIIWQQPHIILLLDLMYRDTRSQEFLIKNWQLVKETADFMASFVAERDGYYHLEGPIAASQEIFAPNEVVDPTFEIEYWRYGFHLANQWAKRIDESADWQRYEENMAPLDESQDTYVPINGIENTFTEHNHDHPTFIGVYGLMPTRMNPNKVHQTLAKVLEKWNHSSFWGWDYPMMAMVASCLGNYDESIDLLLTDDPKNDYLPNGHNYQNDDLPLYLPGNGAFLLAVASIAHNFPDKVISENMNLS